MEEITLHTVLFGLVFYWSVYMFITFNYHNDFYDMFCFVEVHPENVLVKKLDEFFVYIVFVTISSFIALIRLVCNVPPQVDAFFGINGGLFFIMTEQSLSIYRLSTTMQCDDEKIEELYGYFLVSMALCVLYTAIFIHKGVTLYRKRMTPKEEMKNEYERLL